MKRYLWGFLSLAHISLYAQNSPAVKNTQTDKTYANTTEIYKSKTASDEQVLNEISGDYGLGDIVRISDAPPPPKPVTPSVPAAQKEIITAKPPLTAVKTPTVETPQVGVTPKAILVNNKTPMIETPQVEVTPKAVLISNKMPNDPSYTEGVTTAVTANNTMTTERIENERVNTERKSSVSTSSKSSSRSSKSYASTRRGSHKKSSFFSLFKPSKVKKTKRRVPKNNGKMGCYKF